MVQEISADMEYVNRKRATLCEVFLEATESCLWGFRVYQCEKMHGNVICLLREAFVTVGREFAFHLIETTEERFVRIPRNEG